MINKANNTYEVSDKGGSVLVTTSGNVATMTAVDVTVREVLLQAAQANASAVVVNIFSAASAALGLVVPAAVTTVGFVGANALRLSVSSLTALQFYAAEDGDKVSVMWRN